MPARKALEGIFYVLRTGCQWKALPREYGNGSTVHRRFQEWSAAGFFEKIWSKGLEQYDELEGIGWEWQSLDGCMIKAPLALESVGKNPTDRGKMGTKRSVLVDEKGLPLAIVISGANTHDIVTTVEKRYKGHHQRKRQREGFFSKSASAKPRNVR